MRWHDAMRRALSIDGGLDGVPMLLAISDERPAPPTPPPSGNSTTDGAAVTARLDECRAELAPSARDDDLGIVITVLATVAAEEGGS